MKFLRKWATPLTVGSTFIVTISGLMLFFHFSPGLTRPAHEWIGWVMAAAVIAHLVLNFRALTTYFRKPWGIGIMGVSMVVMGLSLFDLAPAGATGGSPVPLLMGAVERAPIERVIALSGHTVQDGLGRLRDNGFEVLSGQSVSEITGGDRGRQAELIRTLFVQ